jgi:hypothetical protein
VTVAGSRPDPPGGGQQPTAGDDDRQLLAITREVAADTLERVIPLSLAAFLA